MYAQLKLIKRAKALCQEADKNLGLAQRRYKMDYDCLVRFVDTFGVEDYVFMGRPPLLRSAAESSASEESSKLLSRKQGPYSVVIVNENTLIIVQDGLESTVSIHRATLASNSRCYCAEPERENDGWKGKTRASKEIVKGTPKRQGLICGGKDGLAHWLGSPPKQCGGMIRYRKEDGAIEPPTTYLSTSLTRIFVFLISEERKRFY